MTLVKAQACMNAISTAGFDATMHLNADGSWSVRASSSTLNIDITQAKALADSIVVTGKISLVEYT